MHLTDDTLLQLTLDVLEPVETAVAMAHLKECAECRERFASATNDVATIGSVRPAVTPIPLPKSVEQTVQSRSYLRAAALLLIGFGAGALFTWTAQRMPPTVTPYYYQGNTPSDSVASIVSSDATDVKRF
jgi:predicted anti-sigma-YlaC factor YlaD